MQLKLVVTKGKHAGQKIAVPGPKFLIGRADECHLRPNSEAISRHHCVIMLEPGYVGVRDFGSKNGTYVNEDRVVGERPLATGDILRMGPLEFEALIDLNVGGKKHPKVKDVSEVAARLTADAPPPEKDLDISEWMAEEPAAKSGAGAAGDTDRINTSELAETMADGEGLGQAAIKKKKKAAQAEAEEMDVTRKAALEGLRLMQQLRKQQPPGKK